MRVQNRGMESQAAPLSTTVSLSLSLLLSILLFLFFFFYSLFPLSHSQAGFAVVLGTKTAITLGLPVLYSSHRLHCLKDESLFQIPRRMMD